MRGPDEGDAFEEGFGGVGVVEGRRVDVAEAVLTLGEWSTEMKVWMGLWRGSLTRRLISSLSKSGFEPGS